MSRFEDVTTNIPRWKPAGGAHPQFPVPSDGSGVPPPSPLGGGPRRISFNPLEAMTGGGGSNMTLAALMKRQQELAQQRDGQMQPIQSWTQGASHMLDKFLGGYERGATDRRLDEGNAMQAGVLASMDPETGLVPDQGMDQLAAWNPELWAKLMDDRQAQKRWEAEMELNRDKLATEGGPKYNDVASMAQDFSDTPDVKAYQISQPRWISMQDAAQRDDAQSDLTMIIDSAKLSDPSSVVMTSEGEKVVATGGATDHLAAWFKYMTGTPGARLSKNVRLGLLREGYNRMNSYYTGVQSATNQYTERAKRWGFEPADVVRQFAAPTPFDPEKVLGGAGVDTPPPAQDATEDTDAETTQPEGTIGATADGADVIVRNGRWVPLAR